MPDNLICPFCKNTKSKEVILTEKHDLLVCNECNSSITITSKSFHGKRPVLKGTTPCALVSLFVINSFYNLPNYN